MSKKDDIKKQIKQIANGETPSQSKSLPGQQPPGAEPVTRAVTPQESALDRAMAAIAELTQHNAAQAAYLGAKLAESEQAFPLVMMESYQKRTAELREAGLDANTFLGRLEGQARRLAQRDITVALPELSDPSPLLALPQRTGTDSHD